jgi:diaminopimelate epimerase
MRIIVDNIVDIPYENFIFRSLVRNTETGIHTYFVAVNTTNPHLVIELKEIYSEDELKDLITTISAAYCNGAKRVNI